MTRRALLAILALIAGFVVSGPGPSTPVTTNWASGKRSPSRCMNGIEPPSPVARWGLPKAAVDAASNDASSQGASGGASQPFDAPEARQVTVAP